MLPAATAAADAYRSRATQPSRIRAGQQRPSSGDLVGRDALPEDQLVVLGNDVSLEFADDAEPVRAIELLRALVERRAQQEKVLAPGKVPLGEFQQGGAHAAAARLRRHR